MDRSASARLWLSSSEVADLFGVTTRTVARWIDDGALPGYRMPGRRGSRRVIRVKLVHFIQQRPEFHFALELLNGQPITAGRSADAERPEGRPGGPDRRQDTARGNGAGQAAIAPAAGHPDD